MNDHDKHDIELTSADLERSLKFEELESRMLLAADALDLGNTIDSAVPIEPASDHNQSVAAEISTADDVDLYRVALEGGQTIDINVDLAEDGQAGAGSHVRVFNEDGAELTASDNSVALGGASDVDSHLRFTPEVGGVYYIGVSSAENTAYDPVTGASSVDSSEAVVGSYDIEVSALSDETVSGNAPSSGSSGSMVTDGDSSSNGGLVSDVAAASSLGTVSGGGLNSNAMLGASGSFGSNVAQGSNNVVSPFFTSSSAAILTASTTSGLSSNTSGGFNSGLSGFAAFGIGSGFAGYGTNALAVNDLQGNSLTTAVDTTREYVRSDSGPSAATADSSGDNWMGPSNADNRSTAENEASGDSSDSADSSGSWRLDSRREEDWSDEPEEEEDPT